MIAIRRAKREKRDRDQKRQRLVLTVGDSATYHLSRLEALKIRNHLNRMNLGR